MHVAQNLALTFLSSHRYNDVPIDYRGMLMRNITRVFQRATLDFIQLQEIDYSSSFS